MSKTQKERKFDYLALDFHVLAVAVEGGVNDLAAYIGSVEGNNHEREAKIVAENGTKLPYEVAKILFPYFDETLTWRS